MKRGTKIHWNGKGIYYSPCGMSTTYYKVVSVEKFSDVPVDERCKRCNDAFDSHSKYFLKADTIYHYESKPVTFRLILSCKYNEHSSTPYQHMRVYYIEFNNDLSIIKTKNSNYTSFHCGLHSKKWNVKFTTEKINYIKRLSRIIEG